MIPRLSRAEFNVLAGSAPESRGRQPSSHQTSLHTRTHSSTEAYIGVHRYTQASTRARDTYLRSTALHVRTRALLHIHGFFRLCAQEHATHTSKPTAGLFASRVCFTRTIRRYCYFCDQALSIPSFLSLCLSCPIRRPLSLPAALFSSK